jgi:hypothetical protein
MLVASKLTIFSARATSFIFTNFSAASCFERRGSVRQEDFEGSELKTGTNFS